MPHSLKTFFDEETHTLTYVVYDENSKDAVIIDPVLDYNPAASKVSDIVSLQHIWDNHAHLCPNTA
jgi:glyoxylase-like metal-dependent hydrolase (beta-lactamase superfamily II)